jgi:cell division septation protein DedD
MAVFLKGETPLPEIDPDQELEEKDLPEPGRPPRNRSLLLLGMVIVAGAIVAGIVFLMMGSPKETDTASRQPDPMQTASSGESGETPAGRKATAAPEQASSGEASHGTSDMPTISLPADADNFELEAVMLPPRPYCIFVGAYKDFQEAATTQSELDSNYLAAYIIPIEIKGNVAQSLFGVTQDGLWYRVLTGHFSSKEAARNTLAIMMEELPGYQPEILRFPYTLECGRFLVPDPIRALSERLDREGVFHYTQQYPTSDGQTLTRVLVGCFFSKKGAEDQAGRLQGKGFTCQLTER